MQEHVVASGYLEQARVNIVNIWLFLVFTWEDIKNMK